MKIFCVGRNYSEHAKELGNAVPEKPVIFIKPDTALLKDNKPFYLPDFTDEIHYETELVFRIGKNGKHIDEKFAEKYVDAVTVGIDFTARKLQTELKSKGLPWELSKAFDNSAVIGNFHPIQDINNIAFSMNLNGTMAQSAHASEMIFNLKTLIVFLSKYFTLRQGDLLFTGTPAGVAAVKVGDSLEGFLGNEPVFNFQIK